MQFSWSDDLLPITPLRFLEQHVEAGFYWLDIASQKTVWSDGIYDLLNLVPGEVVPSREALRRLIHPDDRRPVDEIDRMYTSGRPFHIEYRIITPDRRLRWISNRGEFLMDLAGKPSTVVGILQNVDVSHRSNELIDDYRQRLATMPKLFHAAAWIATPDAILTYVSNWEAASLALAETVGSKLMDLLHQDDQAHSRAIWQAAKERGEEFICEHRMLHNDGSYHWYRSNALPAKSMDGSIREWAGLTVDIHYEKTGESFQKADAAATGAQIRAARSILRLSVKDLSDVTGVPIGTIRRIEDTDGIAKDEQNVSTQLRTELEKRGTVFIFPAGLKPAVCPT